MVLRIDPRLPLVWRSPSSLQWGVSRPVVVLDAVTSAEERMIAALIEGVSNSGFIMIGRAAGASDTDVASLLERVQPALLPPPSPPRTVRVVGRGATAEAVATAIDARGFRLSTGECELAVLVANFVVAPGVHAYWLRRDIPHLPVVVGDSTIEIGPVVEPGRSPCVRCASLDRRDADPAWPALAAQLDGTVSAVDIPAVAGEVAAIVARLVSARLREGPTETHRVDELELDSGELSSREVEPHPECGCVELMHRFGGATIAEGRRESATVGVAPVAMLPRRHPPLPPTTERAATSLA